MISLHKTTEEVKIIAKWGSIALVCLIVLIFLIRIGANLKEYFFPTPPPPPTVSFGKIPEIVFPEKNATDKSLVYSLNTDTGKLPVLPDRATIFKIIQDQPNLLALKRAQERLSKIGFVTKGTPISSIMYQWGESSGRIIVNILSFNFNFSLNYLNDPHVISANKLPDENGAIEKATSFLSNLNAFPSDIDTAKTKTSLFTIQNNSLFPATSLSSARIIKVDFFQKDMNNLPIFYPYPPTSTINLLVGGGEFQSKVVEANIFHQNISDTSATYPIKTADEAFTNLKEEKAYIASYYGNTGEISIKNIYLGYYMSDKTQNYLMPIVIFEGGDGFFAYVSAVKDVWLTNN